MRTENTYEPERPLNPPEPKGQWEEFDWDSEDHIASVAPYGFAKPIHKLLSAWAQTKPGEPLYEELNALYEACVEAWADQ